MSGVARGGGVRRARGRVRAALAAVALVLASGSAQVATAPTAQAAVRSAFTAAYSSDQNGAIALIGNSQLTCSQSVNSGCTTAQSQVGTTSSANYDNNSFRMGFADRDSDSSTTSSTSADLSLPAGSTVLYARLVWSGRQTAGIDGSAASGSIGAVKLRVPGASAYTSLTATRVSDPGMTGTDARPYQASLDVTSAVAAAGNGTYWVADISAATGYDRYAGWALVVAYRNASAPLRNLTIFEGFADVTTAGSGDSNVSIPLSGFLTPATGTVNASVGLVAWEGDQGIVGDALRFNGSTLSDATHPATNFANSSISDVGTNLTARSPSFTNNFGVDITRVSANGVLTNAQTSTTVNLTTAGDYWYPGVVTTQVDLYTPAFSPITKTVVNLSGNDPAKVGDTLQYQLTFSNTGADYADSVVARDTLAAGLNYVPGSIVVTTSPGGVNNGAKTDATGDDIGEYVSASRLVRVRLGTGASASAGGTVAPNATVSLRFNVTLDRSAAGTSVGNVASLDYRARTLGRDYTFAGNPVSTAVGQVADLAVTKTSSPASLTAGSGLTYNVAVTNNGPSAATGVQVVDTLPSGVAYVSSAPPSGTTCSVSGQQVTCTTASLASGASVAVPITVAVAAGTPAGTLTNSVTVTSSTSDDNGTNNSATAVTSVTTAADVSVTQSAAPASVSAGGQVTFTVVAANAGPSAATGVTLTDPLPPGTTLVSATPTAGTCAVAGGTLSCSLGTLNPGASATVTVVLAVASSVTAATLANPVTVGSTTADAVPANNTATAAVALVRRADLRVTKTAAGSPVTAGTDLTYTVVVSNAGPSDATGVTVTDPVVTGLTLEAASSSLGACTTTSGVATCGVGTLASGASATITLRYAVSAGYPPGSLANTATVSSSTTDSDSSSNSATSTVTVTGSADLALVKSATPAVITFGANVTYVLTASNAGPSQATGVSVRDPLPAGFQLVSSQDGCTAASGVVTCPVGTLASGASATVRFVASSPPGGSGPVTNTATLSATTADPDATNNVATTVSNGGPRADVSVTKATSASPVAGRQLTYTVTVANAGPSAAAGVVVTDVLPPGVGFVSGTGDDGTVCTAAAGTVTCSVGTMADDETVVLTLVGAVAAGFSGDSTNTATATTTTIDPTPGNNTASSLATVGRESDVSIAVTPDRGIVVAGERADYTVVVRNAGPSTATGVVATGQVPDGMVPVIGSSGGACTVTGIQISCVIGSLPPGGEVTFPLAAVVRASTPAGPITGTGLVGSTSPDLVTGNNSAPATITVVTRADLQAAKTVSPSPVVAGANATYVLTVTNSGPSDATAVALADSLPAAFTPVGALPSVGTCSVSGQDVSCTADRLPAGSSLTVQVTGLVAAAATGAMTNTMSATSAVTDPAPGDNTASLSTTLTQQADLRLTKAVAEQPVAGAATVYTLVLTNAGPSAAAATELHDELPGGMTVLTDGLVASAGSCGLNSGRTIIDCAFGTLGVGESRTVTLAVLVAAGQANGSTLTNTATATTASTDPTPGDATATVASTVATQADIAVSKQPVEDPPEAGSTLSYVVSVANHGPSVGRSVVLTDPLPDGASFVSAAADSGSCSRSGQTVTCNLGDIGRGSVRTVQLTVSLAADLAGTTLSNTASATSTTADPDATNNASTHAALVAGRSQLLLTKTPAAPTALAGGTVTWLLSLTNLGPSDARDATVTDPVPAGLTVVSAAASGGGACGTDDPVSCGWDLLVPGQTETVTLVMALPPTLLPGTVVSNVAVASSDHLDPDSPTTATASVVVTTGADLSVTKELLTAAPVAGGPVQWRVTVHNDGPSVAADVTVDDTAAAGVVFTGATPSQGGCSVTGSGMHCELGSLADGAAATVTVDATLAADFGDGELTNSATAGSATDDPDPSDNTGTATDPAQFAYDLGVTLQDEPDPVTAGARVTWAMTVTNAGPSAAPGVAAVLELPAGVSDVLVSAPPGLTCSVSGATVTCTAASLAPTGSPGLVVQAAAAVPADEARDTLTATATVTPAADLDPADNEAVTQTAVDRGADIEVSVAGPATAVAGAAATWSVTVTNRGPGAASAVRLSLLVPTGLTRAVATPTLGSCSAGECQLGDLASGQSVTVTVTGTVDAGLTTATLVLAAAATSTTPDFDPDDNTDSDATEITRSADLWVTKSAAPDPAFPGRPLAFTIEVGSAGPSTAGAVVVTDAVPEALLLPTASTSAGSCAPIGSDRVLTCSLGALAAGESVSVTVTGVLDSTVPVGSVANTATVTSDIADPEPADNAASTGTPVAPADLVVTKTADPDAVSADGTITWTVSVRNDGPGPARGVALTDSLPAGVHDLTAEPSAGACDPPAAGAPMTCALGTVDEGVTVTVDVTATVDLAYSAAELTNTAAATSADDPDASNNTAGVTVPVSPGVDLSLAKEVSSGGDVAGGRVAWRLTVMNSGAHTATGVVLADMLPDTVRDVTSEPAGACEQAGGALLCDVGELAEGQAATVDLTAVVDPDLRGALVNAAVVTADQPDTADSDNEAVVTTQVEGLADLSVTKTVDAATVRSGETVTYTVTVRNAGPSSAGAATVTESLPVGATPVSASPSRGTYDAASHRWELDPLAPGEAATLTMTARLTGTGEAVNRVTLANLAEDDPDSGDLAAAARSTVTRGGGGSIPLTGAVVLPALGVGAALLLAGGVLVLLGRRGRTAPRS